MVLERSSSSGEWRLNDVFILARRLEPFRKKK